MKNVLKDEIGNKFSNLIVISYYGKDKKGKALWNCQCFCGNFAIVVGSNLRSGNTKSCGCLQKERVRKANKTHGFAGGTREQKRFYRSWTNMITRCTKPSIAGYEHYGGRGITVCERWLQFLNFKEDMYVSYLKHVKEFDEKNTTLDRFPNVMGNYEPSNCRWATLNEQMQNTRVSSKSQDFVSHNYWKHLLHSGINAYIRDNCDTPLFKERYGCTLFEFKKYIESLWKENMTWENRGNDLGTWSMDHIKECREFDLSKGEDRLKCFHYSNLQPLWNSDHYLKSSSFLNKITSSK
jgi:hypothetical protein